MYINTTHQWEDGPGTLARVGQVVEIHPGTDTWMRGDRFGEVVKLGRKWVHVRFYVSGRTLQVHPIRLRLDATKRVVFDVRPAYATSWPEDIGL